MLCIISLVVILSFILKSFQLFIFIFINVFIFLLILLDYYFCGLASFFVQFTGFGS